MQRLPSLMMSLIAVPLLAVTPALHQGHDVRSYRAPRLLSVTEMEVEESVQLGISPSQLLYLSWVESHDNAKARHRQPNGVEYLGVLQFSPVTAQALGIDPMNAAQAIHGGALYLKHLSNRDVYCVWRRGEFSRACK